MATSSTVIRMLIRLAALTSMIQSAIAAPTTLGGNSPAINTLNGNIVYDYPVINKNNTTNNYYHSYPTSKSLNSLERKQEALLVASNPTDLEVVEVSFLEFLGESGPQLTVKLRNPSNLPALNVKVSIPDEQGNPRPDVPFSKMLMQFNATHLSIPPGKEVLFPLVSVSETRKLLQRLGSIENYCIFAASARLDDMRHPMMLEGVSRSTNRPIPIKYAYETIFQEKKWMVFAASVYLAPGVRNTSGTSEWADDGVLRCLD